VSVDDSEVSALLKAVDEVERREPFGVGFVDKDKPLEVKLEHGVLQLYVNYQIIAKYEIVWKMFNIGPSVRIYKTPGQEHYLGDLPQDPAILYGKSEGEKESERIPIEAIRGLEDKNFSLRLSKDLRVVELRVCI
jgi:hypothetical protein